jgi:hypothetical protein
MKRVRARRWKSVRGGGGGMITFPGDILLQFFLEIFLVH